MPKRIIVCSDGTGNTAIKGRGTNVFKLFEAVDLDSHRFNPDVTPQIAIYDDGVGTEQFKPLMKNIYAKHDWQEYGGAPLLGVGGYVLICHGRSEAKAIMNAIRVGKQISASGINEKIVALLGQESAKADASAS